MKQRLSRYVKINGRTFFFPSSSQANPLHLGDSPLEYLWLHHLLMKTLAKATQHVIPLIFRQVQSLVLQHGLRSISLAIGLIHPVTNIGKILRHQHRVLGQEIHHRNIVEFRFRNLGHHDHLVHKSLRQLSLHIKCSNGFHLVAKEIQAIWHFGRERINIDNATTNGVLSRLIYIIDPHKAQLIKSLLQLFEIQRTTFEDGDGVFREFVLRHHLLRQCFGIRNYIQ